MKRALNLLAGDWKLSRDAGLLILSLVFGLVLLYGYGFGKMSGIFSGQEIHFRDPIGIGAAPSFYLAAFTEGICTVLLILGLFSRIATFVLSINFLVIFTLHAFVAGDGFNLLEVRFIYLFSFIALTLTGPGRFSLDYLLFHGKNKPRSA